MDILKGKDLLHAFVQIADIINDITFAELSISVISGDEYLYYLPSNNINLKRKPGDKILKGTAAYECMHTNRRVVKVISSQESNYGVPYIANAFPIRNESGIAAGCIVTFELAENHEILNKNAQNLASIAQQLTASIQNIHSNMEEVASFFKDFVKSSEETNKKMQETGDIIGIINDVSSQTNLLGLNAAIEAARVGEQGKGFGIVADEIRKLSDNTKTSTKKANTILTELRENMLGLKAGSIDLEGFLKENVKSIEEVSSASQELASISLDLDNIVKKLLDTSKFNR